MRKATLVVIVKSGVFIPLAILLFDDYNGTKLRRRKLRKYINLKHRIIYTFIPWYTGLGITTRTVTLEVRGRKTGRPIRVSLSRTDYSGRSYFVSLGGESQWVRNVRAADGQAFIIFGGRTPVNLVEIKPENNAPILHEYIQDRAFRHSGAQSARHFFGLGSHPTLQEMQAIADRYVVFEIVPR